MTSRFDIGVVIELPGEPIGKARPRFGKGRVYTEAATKAYEKALGWQAKIAMKGRPPMDGPLAVTVLALMAIPESWTQKRIGLALAGKELPTGKPDTDNCVKAALDACNRIVWGDDAQIVDLAAYKRYATKPLLRIKVQIWSAKP